MRTDGSRAQGRRGPEAPRKGCIVGPPIALRGGARRREVVGLNESLSEEASSIYHTVEGDAIRFLSHKYPSGFRLRGNPGPPFGARFGARWHPLTPP